MRSERLFLRPAWPEDWADLHNLIDDEALAFADRAPAPRYPQFLITLPDHHGAQAIGMTGLAACDGQTELGVWIARAWCNRGFATEAARAALHLARTLGHSRIVASHRAAWPAGGRVLAKLGFVPTGQMRHRRGEWVGDHALELCPPASDPVDPAMLTRAA